MNRLQESLRRKRAIERVAREEFDLQYGRDIYGSAWASAHPARRSAAISLTTDTIERYERALAGEGPAS